MIPATLVPNRIDRANRAGECTHTSDRSAPRIIGVGRDHGAVRIIQIPNDTKGILTVIVVGAGGVGLVVKSNNLAVFVVEMQRVVVTDPADELTIPPHVFNGFIANGFSRPQTVGVVGKGHGRTVGQRHGGQPSAVPRHGAGVAPIQGIAGQVIVDGGAIVVCQQILPVAVVVGVRVRVRFGIAVSAGHVCSI